MKKRDRYKLFLEYFSKNHPTVKTELKYRSVFELLVSVILSAQCTDKRVNRITPEFFKSFPTANTLAIATHENVYEHIKSCSYPNNKTKHLTGMAKMLIEEYNGIVPSDINDLQKLPGVGRKTANVIAAVAFNKPSMPVDTHVFRVSARIGLTTNAKTPFDTEMQLIRFIPEDKISIAHHWILLHGRYICLSRKPKCEICGINDFCKFYKNRNR